MSAGTVPISDGAALSVRHLYVRARHRAILTDISIDIPDKEVTAVIGPSGCGKTTFIRSLNRMVETTRGLTVEGSVLYRGQEIYSPSVRPGP
ncbi:phosphate ABC transporter, ATPase subunit, partial [mine drainage metagenome]